MSSNPALSTCLEKYTEKSLEIDKDGEFNKPRNFQKRNQVIFLITAIVDYLNDKGMEDKNKVVSLDQELLTEEINPLFGRLIENAQEWKKSGAR